MVFAGLVIAWRFATWPTSRSPLFVKPTTDGVVRPPSSLGITLGSPPSITATTEFVVPKSIPIIFAIASLLLPAQSSCASLCFQASHLSLLLSSYLMLGLTSWIHSLAICRTKNAAEGLRAHRALKAHTFPAPIVYFPQTGHIVNSPGGLSRK